MSVPSLGATGFHLRHLLKKFSKTNVLKLEKHEHNTFVTFVFETRTMKDVSLVCSKKSVKLTKLKHNPSSSKNQWTTCGSVQFSG